MRRLIIRWFLVIATSKYQNLFTKTKKNGRENPSALYTETASLDSLLCTHASFVLEGIMPRVFSCRFLAIDSVQRFNMDGRPDFSPPLEKLTLTTTWFWQLSHISSLSALRNCPLGPADALFLFHRTWRGVSSKNLRFLLTLRLLQFVLMTINSYLLCQNGERIVEDCRQTVKEHHNGYRCRKDRMLVYSYRIRILYTLDDHLQYLFQIDELILVSLYSSEHNVYSLDYC